MIKTYLFLVLTVILYSCHLSGRIKQDSPYGENITLYMNSSREVRAELISLTDSSIFINDNLNIKEIKHSQIERLKLNEVYQPGIKIFAEIFLLAAEILVLSSSSDSDMLIVYGLSFPLTIYSFFIYGPKTKFTFPLQKSDAGMLKKYCRYPFSISKAQLSILQKGAQGSLR